MHYFYVLDKGVCAFFMIFHSGCFIINKQFHFNGLFAVRLFLHYGVYKETHPFVKECASH